MISGVRFCHDPQKCMKSWGGGGVAEVPFNSNSNSNTNSNSTSIWVFVLRHIVTKQMCSSRQGLISFGAGILMMRTGCTPVCP